MNDSGRVVGVVPSAGASRRMGTTKALLEVGGRSFVARAVGALAEGGCDRVLVVVAEGDDEVAEAAEAVGAIVLANPDPGDGPITSLRLAIRYATAPDEPTALAYLPVDHPLVRPETVALLIREARSSGAPLTLPMRGEKRGHPAVFGSALLGELLDPSLEGGARTVVHRHLEAACLVQVDDPGVLADVDTPEEYAAIVGETGP